MLALPPSAWAQQRAAEEHRTILFHRLFSSPRVCPLPAFGAGARGTAEGRFRWAQGRGAAQGRVPQAQHDKTTATLKQILRRANQAILDQAAREKGAHRFPSGLVYTELKPGTGASPGPKDSVFIHVRGIQASSEGRAYDSTYRKGAPGPLLLASGDSLLVRSPPRGSPALRKYYFRGVGRR